MNDFNMPPGVSTRDIPQGDDELEDRLAMLERKVVILTDIVTNILDAMKGLRDIAEAHYGHQD